MRNVQSRTNCPVRTVPDDIFSLLKVCYWDTVWQKSQKLKKLPTVLKRKVASQKLTQSTVRVGRADKALALRVKIVCFVRNETQICRNKQNHAKNRQVSGFLVHESVVFEKFVVTWGCSTFVRSQQSSQTDVTDGDFKFEFHYFRKILQNQHFWNTMTRYCWNKVVWRCRRLMRPSKNVFSGLNLLIYV